MKKRGKKTHMREREGGEGEGDALVEAEQQEERSCQKVARRHGHHEDPKVLRRAKGDEDETGIDHDGPS